jgi:hypothetical protein
MLHIQKKNMIQKICPEHEQDESCFNRRKCSCIRLCATAWVFVDVEQESGRPVLHMSLIAPPRLGLPSRCVYSRNLRLTGIIPLNKSIIFLLMQIMDSEELDQWKPLVSLVYKVL